MNWFVSNGDLTLVAVDACILAVGAFCAFFAAFALVAVVAVAVQTRNALRSKDLLGQDHQLGASKRRVREGVRSSLAGAQIVKI